MTTLQFIGAKLLSKNAPVREDERGRMYNKKGQRVPRDYHLSMWKRMEGYVGAGIVLGLPKGRRLTLSNSKGQEFSSSPVKKMSICNGELQVVTQSSLYRFKILNLGA